MSTMSEVNQFAERASVAAARLLGVPVLTPLQDQQELSAITPAAYLLFAAAEDLVAQPNDTGLDQAIEKYQKVLEMEPRFALGYARLSMAYARRYQKASDRAALGVAAKNAYLALKYNPNSAKGVLSQAVVDLHTGNTQQAMDGLAKALQLDPQDPRILLYKARALRDLALHHDEEDVYREILRARPNFWPAYNELGWILHRQSRYREAADIFAEGSAVAPQVALLLTNLGTMYLLLDQSSDAETAFRRSLERTPNELAYLNLGSIVFERGDYRKALQYYGQARDLKPKNDHNWRNIADCYFILGEQKLATENYAKAAQVLSESLRINPRRGARWMTLALYDAKLGRRTQAEANLREAESRGATDVQAQFTKAQVLAVLGRREEAMELVLACMDKGLSILEVELAVDLKEARADPRYRRKVEKLRSKS
jgi:tetratricopeptide (TPR) repeat protein